MDILNWLYLAKNKFVRSTPSSQKDFMIFGAKVGTTKRGDLYQNYAMSVEDFTTNVSNVVKPYKVYTALLTQSGGGGGRNIQITGSLSIGTTYEIYGNSPGMDFTNVGAPNNNVGTHFVATGTTPNSWGSEENTGDVDILAYYNGAPTVTVLENTIGNVWLSYDGTGSYSLNLEQAPYNNIYTLYQYIFTSEAYGDSVCRIAAEDDNIVTIQTRVGTTGDLSDDKLPFRTPVEIRVYN